MSSDMLSRSGSAVGDNGVQEITRFVEVPVVEEVVRAVPKRECVEVEKRFERKETEVLEKVVEVPQVRRVKKIVEVPRFQEVVKTVTRKEVVPVPKEVIKYVTRKEARVVEKEQKVKGEVVEVPKIVDVIKEVIVPRYIDTEVPTVVAQTIVPIVTDEDGVEQVDAITYDPYMVPVDVYIPKPVDRPVVCKGKTHEELKPVEIPAPQYNLILRNLNASIIKEKQVYRDMPFRAEADGTIHFLNSVSCGGSKENLEA